MFLLLLVVLAGVAFRVSTPEERDRFKDAIVVWAIQLKTVMLRPRPEYEAFREALRARTPYAYATLAIVALNLVVFALMVPSPGPVGEPTTLIGWGAHVGSRTTNGEWWRLVSTLFVHWGFMHLVVNVLTVLQLGLVLERLVGYQTFAATYIVGGLLAGVATMSAEPLEVSAGPSGSIFGLYGLLIASVVWGVRPRSVVTIPQLGLNRLAPTALLFVVTHAINGGTGSAFVPLAIGLVAGLVVTRGVSASIPPPRRVASAMGATALVVLAAAVPLRGLTDVSPVLERIHEVERRTAAEYDASIGKFRKRQLTPEALVQQIELTIVPELERVHGELAALDKVPPAQQPIVVRANEYFRLRQESWSLRVEGLRKTDMLSLRRAEQVERASLESLPAVDAATPSGQ
jgi:rhomboid protease GluP